VNNKPVFIAFILLFAFLSGSIWSIFQYVSSEKQRDLDDWHARLNIMAESQKSVIESWFEKQIKNMDTLASNPLVQLYVSQSYSEADDIDETRRGQFNHLKNLLSAIAGRADAFTPVQKISGNEKNTINDGLAIISKSKVLLATRYFPVNDEKVKRFYTQALNKQSVFVSDVYENEQGPRLVIVVPVSSVQSIDSTDTQGAVVAVINPKSNLFQLLLKEWVTTKTDETLLVSVDGNQVKYLNPLQRGYDDFYQTHTSASAAGYAIKDLGHFVVQKDYSGLMVLATAKAIRNTSMLLVQKIEVEEALAESTTHQNFILTVFLLVAFLIGISFIAIWRHATSLHLQKATRRLRARSELLNAIGDSVNDHTFLLDHKNKLVFINDALSKSFSIDNSDVRGKALNHIFNNEITDILLALKPKGNEKNVRNKELRLEFKDKRNDYHVSVIALNHPDYKQSYLYVMHDITLLKDVQGNHNRLMEGVISTLTQLIDKHDPHCVHHSERTKEVAVEIARAMGLSQDRIDALAMAALLANIGKLYVPAEILTTERPLTADEELKLRENVNHSVELLEGLEFHGPVVSFVQQKNECLDGGGYPKGVAGDEIYQESRILSVANAFVAMTSSRAYRSGKPIKEVLEILIAEADSRYDRHVIAALFHIVENHSDWSSWQQVKE
jgi:HD-GYP domain-containing protein (c-di-GMP phosphodiesterase class II)